MTRATPDRPLAAVLAEAAAAAGYAPSVHNTQPWRWRVWPDRLELFAERGRQLRATDPEGRLLMLSCGAALHHACLALAAQGWRAKVSRLPDPGQPDLLATVTATGDHPVTPEAMRFMQAMEVRHTDRRPVSDQPVAPATVTAIGTAAHELARVHRLTPEQVLELAAAASRADATEAEDPEVREELDYWTSRSAPAGTGLPAAVLPDRPAQTTVPGRDFGRPGTLPVGSGHDRAAVYLVLYGDEDEPESWLRAGEALSTAWLTATELGASVVPLSGVIEVASTRQTLRRVLSGFGHPYLVLRLGIADPEHAGPPHTPRIPAAQLIDTSPVRPAES
ncbi:MAG TPA: nitroreductase family protein [Pilimelia sp.]|nr:nitroreductase family protein [Pilimelia sp.]